MRMIYTALAAGILVSGCSGGGGQPVQNYGQLLDTGRGLFAQVREEEWSPQSAIPTTGAARYNGVFIATIAGGSDGDERVQGVVQIDADFRNNEISGGVGNIANENDQPYGGTLPIENGQIDRTVKPTQQWVFGADIDGTLVSPRNNEVAVDAVIVGNFVGPDSDQIVGRIGGTIIEDGQQLTIQDTTVIAAQ